MSYCRCSICCCRLIDSFKIGFHSLIYHYPHDIYIIEPKYLYVCGRLLKKQRWYLERTMCMSSIVLNFQDNFNQHCSQVCELCVFENLGSYTCLQKHLEKSNSGGSSPYMAILSYQKTKSLFESPFLPITVIGPGGFMHRLPGWQYFQHKGFPNSKYNTPQTRYSLP